MSRIFSIYNITMKEQNNNNIFDQVAEVKVNFFQQFSHLPLTTDFDTNYLAIADFKYYDIVNLNSYGKKSWIPLVSDFSLNDQELGDTLSINNFFLDINESILFFNNKKMHFLIEGEAYIKFFYQHVLKVEIEDEMAQSLVQELFQQLLDEEPFKKVLILINNPKKFFSYKFSTTIQKELILKIKGSLTYV
jgi:hypothetical protein